MIKYLGMIKKCVHKNIKNWMNMKKEVLLSQLQMRLKCKFFVKFKKNNKKRNNKCRKCKNNLRKVKRKEREEEDQKDNNNHQSSDHL